MIKACIYKDDPGPILRVISSSNMNKIQLNIKDGQKYTLSDASPDTHYIKNGKVVAYPNKPDHPCHFDFKNGSWLIDEVRCWVDLRQKRDLALSKSDWTQVSDAPANQAAWSEYRQKLRDLPQTTNDPTNVAWPDKPQ